ncbi:DUF4998 domain-containing protein [Chitinophaga defluvii]|uniref:DUF4998 domain-containing protein n=1 Tax=Chitinophaga defluvii TaxID=3163343 RepID=A0ABV2TAI6_9BACT
MKSQHKWYICVAVLGFILSACTKSDDYKKYSKNGEILYPAKADSVISSPGKNRLQLAWVTTDGRIKKYRIFWNGGSDSLEVPVVRNGAGNDADSMKVIIHPLDEANYIFNIYSYDSDGNRSVKTTVEDAVYGGNYESTLLGRGLKQVVVVAGKEYAELMWAPGDSTEVGVKLTYTDNSNHLRTVIFPAGKDTSKVMDYKSGTDFSYVTLFMPVKGAIDTFQSAAITVLAPAALLDKSLFREYPLPGDAGSAWGWQLNYLWDGSIAEGRGYHTPELPVPHHFNFDLGVTASLSEMKWWQRQDPTTLYTAGNPSKFEIWGSNNPAADGSYTGWVKLKECICVKPSGSPVGTNTQQDIDYAAAGELFKFEGGTIPVRYIRVKILEKWSGSLSTHMMEMTFWGSLQ